MIEVEALERGVWGSRRYKDGDRFMVEDDAVSTWFVPVTGPAEPAKDHREPEMTIREAGQEKTVTLKEALHKRGAGRPAAKPEARNMDVLTEK